MLILAESYGHRLTAFDIDASGFLSNRRVWADLDGAYPDGICLDAEQAPILILRQPKAPFIWALSKFYD